MLGVYQVSNRVFQRAYHGLDFSMRPNDGILMISQVGWTPEFFKRPVDAGTTKDGKSVVDGQIVGKDFKTALEHEGTARATIGSAHTGRLAVQPVRHRRRRSRNCVRLLLASRTRWSSRKPRHSRSRV